MADTYSNKGFTVALGLFATLLALYALLQSPLFKLRTVEVVGGDYLTRGDVLAATNLEIGTNLFSIDLRRTARALESNPVVAEARLRRKFPGAVVVILRERRPVVYLAVENGFWTLDEDGIPLFPTAGPTVDLPLITLDPPVEPQAGVALHHPNLLTALRFAGSLSVEGLADLSEIHAQTDGLTAFTRSGIVVYLGEDGDMAAKAGVMEGLLDQVYERSLSVSHIDLRHPKSPVFQQKR